ncbi:MAG TPA: protein kinase [Gemmataceae bacterium]|nr:protein kinase [Gemmataceae bacterium]
MPDLLGKHLGDFEIVREIGRGGMGVVYEARQISLNRKVALKVLSGGLGLTGKAVQRFRREAEAAAKLHHTNIVPVYAIGEEGSQHFYAMELIEGPSLDHVIRHLRGHAPNTGPTSTASADAHNDSPDLAQTGPYVEGVSTFSAASGFSSSSLGSGTGYFDTVASMVAEVADALHYAHQEGIIHRDMKPSNLLLSPAGRLSVNDFGLARMLEQPGMTMTGEFLGTPAYMSPEQIAAGRTPLDHRTDIYSLGATLYELLTLQPPFRGKQRDQILAQILHKEPPPPRKVNPKVPVDLETICLKALDKDPDRRYQSGKAMADDLRCYVNRFAIAARRAGPWTRWKKWMKRHPGVAVLLGCLLVAVLAAGFFASQAKHDRDRLRTELRQAAVDQAILEAMSGDAHAALHAIAEAETKGAEPGRLNMLRGLVEYHRGRPKEAVDYLEQADQQLPRSVAIKALLANAYLDSGRLERYDAMYTVLEHLEPKTPEDHLFLGLFLAEPDPLRALQILGEAPTRFRQSPIARLVRGMVQTWLALKTGKVEDAEQALEDLRKVDLPDHPLLLSARVRAQQVAAHAYGPKDPRSEQAWSQAAQDVERLARHRDNTMALQGRCYYYFVRGEDDALLAAAQQARKEGIEDSWVTDLVASVLYRRKEYDEALRIVQSTHYAGDQSFPILLRGIILAAMPGRKSEAEKAITDAIHACRAGSSLSFLAAFLQVLGPEYRAKTRQVSLEIREHSANRIPTSRDRWYHDVLAFHAELMDADALLEKAGDSRYNQCEAHFYIGLRRLAEGKRAEAKTCFRHAMATGIFFYYEYIWSRAFLARMDDPDWLPWVPVKE